jgi:hypothetical protein
MVDHRNLLKSAERHRSGRGWVRLLSMAAGIIGILSAGEIDTHFLYVSPHFTGTIEGKDVQPERVQGPSEEITFGDDVKAAPPV